MRIRRKTRKIGKPHRFAAKNRRFRAFLRINSKCFLRCIFNNTLGGPARRLPDIKATPARANSCYMAHKQAYNSAARLVRRNILIVL
jgi:hypothetical protein